MKSMRWWSAGVVLTFVILAIFASHPAALAQGGRSQEHWVGTWATAPVPRPQSQPGQAQQGQTPRPVLNFSNQTLRQIVHTSVGGERARVMLSNRFGTAPLEVGAARVALREKSAAIVPKSDRVLTFSGRSSMTIAPGVQIVSDPVDLSVPALADLAVDLYLPGDTAATTSPLTFHAGALQTNYVSPPGNHTGALDMPVMTTTQSWFFLRGVEVAAPEQTGVIAAFGSSTTDGTGSTVDANGRWPDALARRLAAQNIKMGVVNVSVGGNGLLGKVPVGGSLIERFQRDVLEQPGVTHVIVVPPRTRDDTENPPSSVDELIAGHRQLIQWAHGRGLKIYGATGMPFEGNQGWRPGSEPKRQAVNEWIRMSREYDGVIDFDAVMRDPHQPTKLLPEYDSGDHLHPNDAGYQKLANAIDLKLFKAGASH